MSDTFPQDFGRYVLTRVLGEGGMAIVYEANVRVAEGLTKWVVIKKIRSEFADEPEFLRMFVDEAKIALGLNHANIVQVFDFGQVRGSFYLAMELIDGIDVMALYHGVESRGQRIPPGLVALIGQQVATGLAYAHNKRDEFGQPLGLVHRDISPHNVMVDVAGNVKILDFGIARTRPRKPPTSADELGETGQTLKGKIAYMSPEQVHGRPIDHRSDIYSLGVVLYELLTGELLFREKDRLKALERVRSEHLVTLATKAPDVETELASIVDKALARDPERRYATARELAADLARYLHRGDELTDATVLSEYVAQFRQPARDAAERGNGWDQAPTRPVADSHISGVTIGPRRREQKVILLQAAFATPNTGGEPAPDVADFLEVVRDIAFKRDADVHALDKHGGLLVFGTTISTGDDCDRAVRVGLALREAIGEAAPGVGLGLVIAEKVVTVRRNENGHERIDTPQTLVDDLRALAERAIDDHMLVAADLLERLGRAWRFAEAKVMATPSDAPASSEIVQAAPLLGPLSEAERQVQHAPGRRLLLYGRELELKALRDGFSQTIRTQRSRTAIIVGEPGLGRRAVVDRFAASLPQGACAILRGVGQWGYRNTPFRVFLELIRRFLDIHRTISKSEIIAKLDGYGVREADKLADALAGALNLAGAGEHDLDPNERRDRLHRLVRRLIARVSQRSPLLIVIENLHFVDQQSLEILFEGAQTDHALPIFTVITSRPSARVDALTSRADVALIRLRELDEHTRRELIVRRFRDRDEAARLADAILPRTGGNPMFIEEVLASLLHRNVIAWDAQGRLLRIRDPRAVIELPPSIEAVLQARLDALGPEAREVLQTAALLGRSFRPEELVSIAGHAAPGFVDDFIEEGLLERESAPSPSGAPRVRFCTVSLHEVAKASVAPTLATRVHACAAEIKRARVDYTKGRDDGPIAEHLLSAGRAEEAIDPAIAAARDARDVAGNVEAYHFYSQALKALPTDDPRRFEVLLEREQILRAWGRRRAQGADIRELINFAETEGSPAREAIAATRLLRFYLECGRTQRAERLAPRLERLIGSLSDPSPFRPPMAELKSEVSLAHGRFDEAERFAREGLEHCSALPESNRHRIRLLAVAGRVALATARYDQAHTTFTEALELARDSGNRRLEGEMLTLLGEAARHATRYQEAVDCFRHALAIDRDLGDRVGTGAKLANLGITYTHIGLYSRAERYLRKALELHEALGNPRLLNEAMIQLGAVAAELGDHDSARGLLVEAAQIAKSRRDTSIELRARAYLASQLVSRDVPADIDEAERLVGEILEVVSTETDPAVACRALHVAACIAARRGDMDTAIARETESVELVRRGAMPMDGVLYIHQLGIWLDTAGHAEKARRCLYEAADMLARRLDDLRDAELRRGYQEQIAVRRILEDAARAGYAAPRVQP